MTNISNNPTSQPQDDMAQDDIKPILAQLLKNESMAKIFTSLKQLTPDSFDDKLSRWQLKQKPPEKAKENPFSRTGKPASKMEENPSPPEQIWFGLYRGAVTYLAGETGAGKSSALYNLAVHAALGKELWDIPFSSQTPLKVWYLDPENARNQAAWKLKRIGQGLPPNLIIDAAIGVDLGNKEWQKNFKDWVITKNFELVILDPLVNLFGSADENDNSEAVQHMRFLQDVAQETRAALLIVHHKGKGENGSNAHYGRGASARLAAADVGLMWESKGNRITSDDTYQHDEQGVSRQDECRLMTTKNRLGKYGSVYLKMVGDDQFQLSTWEAWRGKVDGGERKSKAEQGAEAISDFLRDGGWKSRMEIVAHLRTFDIGESKADEALQELSDGDSPKISSRKEKNNRLNYAWAEWVAGQEEASSEFL